jgi:hypothetical protein
MNHQIFPIVHAKNNLSKLQFNFARFIGSILALCGPTSLLFHIQTDPQIYQEWDQAHTID